VHAAFSSMVEGKNEDISTMELSGGARIHYIFQSIFVKSLEVWINQLAISFLLFYAVSCLSLDVLLEPVKSLFTGG
jgi:hypothetical protein